MIPTTRQIVVLLVAALLSSSESANQQVYQPIVDAETRRQPAAVKGLRDKALPAWSPRSADDAPANDHVLASDLAAIGAAPSSEKDGPGGAPTTSRASEPAVAYVESYGNACALPGNHLLGLPELRATAAPRYGSETFGFALDHTTGVYGEFVLVALSAAAGQADQLSALPPSTQDKCHESIDSNRILMTWVLPAKMLTTDIPMPLSHFSNQVLGDEVHVQAMVIELLPDAELPYQGISNALKVVIGK